MIGGRLRNGSVRQSHDRKKVDGMNYLIWSESDRQRADRRYRRQWSISDSTTPPSKRPRGSREKIELDRRKSALDSSNEQYHDRSWLSRVSGEMPPEVSKIDSHLLLNIGGNHFRVRCSTIEYRCPTSFLATFARLPHEERLLRCDGYIESSEEYFFERSAKVFEPIYDFLATGHFHRHGDICAERLYQELDYWKINGNMFAPCCMPNVDGSGDEDGEATGSLPSGECDDHYDEIRCSNLRRQLWLLMEDPSSSTSAKGFALVSISMVIVSVTGMILASLPDIQADSVNNSSAIDEENLSLKPHLLLDYIELVCLIWFTIEYLVRFAVCTKKCEFACKPLNIIDSLTIIPFYLEMILHVAGLGAHTIGEFRGLAMVMRGVRVMRVARIFKLARYSSGLKSFGMTVKTSLAELSMLTLFLLTAIIFFSTLMYFAERDEPGTKFKSIPHAGWWCIVTMTTVGYGDFCPQTVFGKLIASCASISGVLVLAFPITMIVENFSKNYDTEKNDFKITQRRRRMAKAFV